MKKSVQLRVAKHALAIWLRPGDKESLTDSLDWAKNSWNNLPQRVLKSWVKELYINPERYEFTGMAYKKLELADFFSLDDIDYVEAAIRNRTMVIDYDDIVRLICQYYWVYKIPVEVATHDAIDAYYGKLNKRHRPAKPKLKPLEKK